MNALGVAEQLGEDCQVMGLSAYGNMTRLLEQMKRYQPEVVSVWEETDAQDIRSKGIQVRGKALKVLSGLEGSDGSGRVAQR